MSIFDNIGSSKPKLNKFDLSHDVKMSAKMGYLYPFICQEVLPGDNFQSNAEIFTRFAPMLAPTMHRVHVKTEQYFVPNRLVWSEWDDFITGGEQGDASPVFPTLTIKEDTKDLFKKGTLSDYFGIPLPDKDGTIPAEGNHKISALPFRAYQTIYNEYYRDQNLKEKVDVKTTSGEVGTAERDEITTLRKRAWEKDYFTSALPWSQRGGEATIPLGSVEPNYKSQSDFISIGGTPLSSTDVSTDSSGGLKATNNATGRIENLDTMDVDATTINDLRKATKLQKWLERQARGGSRYIETIMSQFGVRSKDARLQRPEYLAGGKQPVVISEVLNTTGLDDTGGAPQGDMAGHGISVGRSNRFKKSFTEHGFIIAVVSVIPKTAYSQGIERHWSKFDKFDYYWRDFAHLGEQEVLQQEVYQDYLDETLAKGVFGYQQRYAEYKYNQSRVAGDFRPNENLEFWTMVRDFETAPALNHEFVESDPTKRIFAVTDEQIDDLYMNIYVHMSALRPMPYYSIPEL